MKYCERKKKFVRTDTEKLRKLQREWTEKRDKTPADHVNWEYYNGGINALEELQQIRVWGKEGYE